MPYAILAVVALASFMAMLISILVGMCLAARLDENERYDLAIASWVNREEEGGAEFEEDGADGTPTTDWLVMAGFSVAIVFAGLILYTLGVGPQHLHLAHLPFHLIGGQR